MITVGMMIADRYEIIEKIGTGGMSDVYRAKCHKLNRFVAIKVLKQEFSENTDFVSKFRVEAQAAAGLMHPNIVNVYDVGEENGFHYIVMELVEGITLKKYIEKKARLSVKEAVSIAIGVALGIEAAHNNHIIHRDIKPQNIIISFDGKVKVTDFGIAKAATSNTITSNVMGSVHYTSPEQVRGGFSDEKSDIYSLGITMFEMLTGRVPFNGETTVAVAIKHIQEPMPSPRQFVSEIPVSVEQIVMKCTQKSPDRRYQSAPELIEDLKKSLISPDENFVKIESTENYGATKNISKEELNTIKNVTRQREDYEETISQVSSKSDNVKNTGSNRRAAEKARQLADENPVGYDTEPVVVKKKDKAKTDNTGKTEKSEKSGSSKNNGGKNTQKSVAKSGNKGNSSKKGSPKKSNAKKEIYDQKTELVTTIMIVIAAIIIGCVFLYVLFKALGIDLIANSVADKARENVTQTKVVYEMPNVEGYDAAAVETSLTNYNLKVDKKYQESSEVAENIVISCSVAPGVQVREGDTVTLYVSSGTDGVLLRNVVGLSRAEAVATLENDGFSVSVVTEKSDKVAKDNVISMTPAGDVKVARGASVTITISLGADPVEVPSIVGITEEEALAKIVEAGLEAKSLGEEYSDQYEAGIVIFQDATAGNSVNPGTEIGYKVSLGVEQIYYNCVYTVQAPSDYQGGDAQIVLKGSDDSQLFATTTNTFPVDINVSNIFAISSGNLYITYNINKPEEIVDGDGNVTVQNVQVSTTAGPLAVTFVRAQ